MLKNPLYYFLFVVIFSSLLLNSCSSLKTINHNPSDRNTQNSIKPTHISLWLFGFYNNEKLDGFDPKPIDYTPMFNCELSEIGFGLENYFKNAHNIILDGPPRWALFDSLDYKNRQAEVYDTLDNILKLFNFTLKDGKYPLSFKGISWIDITDDVNDSEIICVVIGLETITKKVGNQKSLRSGLGILFFQRNGHYLGSTMKEYNFTEYLAEEYLIDIAKTIENRFGLTSEFK